MAVSVNQQRLSGKASSLPLLARLRSSSQRVANLLLLNWKANNSKGRLDAPGSI